MIKKFSVFKAYTLAEIVIVMLIISVVVAVTIGVTKKKLDSTISYSYYSAYESLKDVSRALLTDFNPQNENYQASRIPLEIPISALLRYLLLFFTSWYVMTIQVSVCLIQS